MGPSKLRKAIGAVKDQTSIGLAKVGSSASLSDLDVAIVKATCHDEYPPDERHVREIINLTTYSRTFVSACVATISRRLSRTSNWVVALKTLMLIHHLLSHGDPAYDQEIFFATRRGTRLLNLSDFRDRSGRAGAWDYSAFVRTYALYMDEQLEFRMKGKRGKHGGYVCHVEGGGACSAVVEKETPLREMTSDRVFSRINHLMQLMERFLHCKPAGAAKEHRIVCVALYPIVKESFQLCYDITDIMGIFIERFLELDRPDMVKVHEIFSRVSKQYDDIDAFYAWCKTVAIARSSEYPEVEKISKKRLDMMDDYIRERSIMRPEPTPEPMMTTEPEQDLNSIKALPPPEEPVQEQEQVPEKEEKGEEKEVEEPKEEKRTQQEGDLLNLGEDAPTAQEHGDKLALALFDGSLATARSESKTTPWEAFKESSASGDWETALVQSVSHLSNQQVSLPGGFDTLILDGMYQQAAINQAVASSGLIATGSASSVALGSAGRPAMLALPAPPSSEDGAKNTDPFAASLVIPPPPYVQLSEMDKKHNYLVQEQVMWQQYERDGKQGPAALAKANPNSHPYNAGGYTTMY